MILPPFLIVQVLYYATLLSNPPREMAFIGDFEKILHVCEFRP